MSGQEEPERQEAPHEVDAVVDTWAILMVTRASLTLMHLQLMLTVKQSRDPFACAS